MIYFPVQYKKASCVLKQLKIYPKVQYNLCWGITRTNYFVYSLRYMPKIKKEQIKPEYSLSFVSFFQVGVLIINHQLFSSNHTKALCISELPWAQLAILQPLVSSGCIQPLQPRPNVYLQFPSSFKLVL